MVRRHTLLDLLLHSVALGSAATLLLVVVAALLLVVTALVVVATLVLRLVVAVLGLELLGSVHTLLNEIHCSGLSGR